MDEVAVGFVVVEYQLEFRRMRTKYLKGKSCDFFVCCFCNHELRIVEDHEKWMKRLKAMLHDIGELSGNATALGERIDRRQG